MPMGLREARLIREPSPAILEMRLGVMEADVAGVEEGVLEGGETEAGAEAIVVGLEFWLPLEGGGGVLALGGLGPRALGGPGLSKGVVGAGGSGGASTDLGTMSGIGIGSMLTLPLG